MSPQGSGKVEKERAKRERRRGKINSHAPKLPIPHTEIPPRSGARKGVNGKIVSAGVSGTKNV